MDKLIRVAMVLALLGAGAAGYTLTGPYGDYEEAEDDARDARMKLDSLTRNANLMDPVAEGMIKMARAEERAAHDDYYEVRTRCQNSMLGAIPLLGLGFLIGLLGLRRQNKGPAVVSIVLALIGGGMLIPMFVAGVF